MSNRFTRLPHLAACDGRLTHAEFRLLAIICSHCDNNRNDCELKNTTLAGSLKVSERMIRRSLNRLVHLGWIERTEGTSGNVLKTTVKFDFNPISGEVMGSPEGEGGSEPGTSGSSLPGTSGSGLSAKPGTSGSPLPGTSGSAHPEPQVPPELDSKTRLLTREGAKPPPEPAAPTPSLKVSSGPISKGNKNLLVELSDEMPGEWWAYAIRERDDIDAHEVYRLFSAYHQGERKTERQWFRLWRLWVAREKSPGRAIEAVSTDASRNAFGDTEDQFVRKAIKTYDAVRRRSGSSPIDSREELILKGQARKVFAGKDAGFGLARFEIWSAEQLRIRIGGAAFFAVSDTQRRQASAR